MILFFETAKQAVMFLAMMPVGFAAAMCLQAGSYWPVIRPVTDVIVFIAATISILFIIVSGGEAAIRLYHLLGFITGALLWMQGVGKIITRFKQRKDFQD